MPSAIVGVNDYYPFGLTFNSYNRENTVPNDYKYNGKELQDELGLNWLDYGARMYMPDIGRFGTLDRKAEMFLSWSPYNFALNNPVRYEDVAGLGPGDRVKNAKKAVESDVRTYKQYRGEGWTTDGNVDCSEFCREIAVADGYDPGNDSRVQAKYYQDNGTWTTDISEVEVGDFVFWKKNGATLSITHTGVVIAKNDDGTLDIAQAGLQKGGKSINDKYSTDEKGTLWKGTSVENSFVGAGRPNEDGSSPTASLGDKVGVLTDKVGSIKSNIGRLQNKLEEKKAAGKKVGNLENRIALQQNMLSIYRAVLDIYKSQQEKEENK